MFESQEMSVSDGETEGGRRTETEVELFKGEQQKLSPKKKTAEDGCTTDNPKSQRASVPAPVC